MKDLCCLNQGTFSSCAHSRGVEITMGSWKLPPARAGQESPIHVHLLGSKESMAWLELQMRRGEIHNSTDVDLDTKLGLQCKAELPNLSRSFLNEANNLNLKKFKVSFK